MPSSELRKSTLQFSDLFKISIKILDDRTPGQAFLLADQGIEQFLTSFQSESGVNRR